MLRILVAGTLRCSTAYTAQVPNLMGIPCGHGWAYSPQNVRRHPEIERILRSGVLWRKSAFGSHSEGGCRFAERILTVVRALRLQERCVVDYLHQALVAHRSGQPAP